MSAPLTVGLPKTYLTYATYSCVFPGWTAGLATVPIVPKERNEGPAGARGRSPMRRAMNITITYGISENQFISLPLLESPREVEITLLLRSPCTPLDPVRRSYWGG